VLRILTVTSGGFNYAFGAAVYSLTHGCGTLKWGNVYCASQP
jgi:hypothetical protein